MQIAAQRCNRHTRAPPISCKNPALATSGIIRAERKRTRNVYTHIYTHTHTDVSTHVRTHMHVRTSSSLHTLRNNHCMNTQFSCHRIHMDESNKTNETVRPHLRIAMVVQVSSGLIFLPRTRERWWLIVAIQRFTAFAPNLKVALDLPPCRYTLDLISLCKCQHSAPKLQPYLWATHIHHQKFSTFDLTTTRSHYLSKSIFNAAAVAVVAAAAAAAATLPTPCKFWIRSQTLTATSTMAGYALFQCWSWMKNFATMTLHFQIMIAQCTKKPSTTIQVSHWWNQRQLITYTLVIICFVNALAVIVSVGTTNTFELALKTSLPVTNFTSGTVSTAPIFPVLR